MIKEFSDETENVITTSHFPRTTLDLIDIPLDEESSLYDTPVLLTTIKWLIMLENKA